MQAPEPQPPLEDDEKKFKIELPAKLASAVYRLPPDQREALMNLIMAGLAGEGGKHETGLQGQSLIEYLARGAVKDWKRQQREARFGKRGKLGHPSKAERRSRRGK